MTGKDLKRELTALGATFQQGNGSHLKVFLDDRQSVIPMHKSDLAKGNASQHLQAARDQVKGRHMRFPANITCESDGCSVTFVDIPEALTCGDTLEEALHHGVDALETALDFYFEGKRPIPTPSKLRRGQHWIELPATIAAKVLLHNEMLSQKVRPAELARRLSIAPPHVTHLLDPKHPTKIDSIAAALNALGKTLELRVL